MIRLFEYNTPTNYKDFENYVFTSLGTEYFDIPNDKVTIRGIVYRISTINQELEICEDCLFDVIMKSYIGGKISAIKSVRTITGLGLKEAKKFVETLPQQLLSNVSYDEISSAKEIFATNYIDACLDLIKKD